MMIDIPFQFHWPQAIPADTDDNFGLSGLLGNDHVVLDGGQVSRLLLEIVLVCQIFRDGQPPNL